MTSKNYAGQPSYYLKVKQLLVIMAGNVVDIGRLVKTAATFGGAGTRWGTAGARLFPRGHTGQLAKLATSGILQNLQVFSGLVLGCVEAHVFK